MTQAQMEPYRAQIDPAWTIGQRASSKFGTIAFLTRCFSFADFSRAMAFANRVAEMAEAQQHHPDLHVAWGKVDVEIWTHKIGGLTESDFVFAAKCDALAST